MEGNDMDPLVLEGLTHTFGLGGYDDRDECGGAVEERDGKYVCTICGITVGTKCDGPCEEFYDMASWESSGMTGELSEAQLCEECSASDLDDHTSRLFRFSAEGVEHVVFGDHRAYGSDGDIPDWFWDVFPADWSGRNYVRTDGWRGYYDTQFKDLVEIDSGWATGWPDETTQHKIPFTDFMARLGDGQVVPPAPLYGLFEPTSNVFSTASELLCCEEDLPVLRAWLDSVGMDEQQLHRALG